MFTVECPGCKASYQVDERRVPAAGLKMRCPKCSTAFVVEKPDVLPTSDPSAHGADLPAKPVPAARLPVAPGKAVPPAAPVRPAPPVRAPGPPGPFAAKNSPRLGLNVTTSSQQRPGPPAAKGPIVADGESELPATVTKVAVTDLPSLMKPGGVRPRPPTGPAQTEPDEDLLPEPVRPPDRPTAALRAGTTPTKPGIPKPQLPALPPEFDALDLDLPGLALARGKSGRPEAVEIAFEDRDRRDGSRADDLPEVVPNDLPAAPLESDLPAAFGIQRNRAPSVVSARSASSAFGDADLPGVVLSDGHDRLLPAVKGLGQARTPRIESNSPTKGAASPASVPVLTTSTPPELDDFEFELPSPLQAQKGFPELQQGIDGAKRRRGTEPGGFDLPNLAVGLPAKAESNIGLPSVPGRHPASNQTLSGTGSIPPFGVATDSDRAAPGNLMPGTATMEVDLGLDFDLDSGEENQSRRGAVAVNSSTPPDLFGAPVGSLPPALGLGSAPPAASEFNVTVTDMELPVSAAAYSARRPTTSSAPPPSGAIGGPDYGEVSLESSDHELSVETEGGPVRRSLSGEVLEFGGVPQAAPVADVDAQPATVAVEVRDKNREPRLARGSRQETPRGTGSKRMRVVAATLFAALVLGGSALTLVPDVGPFGAHFLVDQLHRKENNALLLQHATAGALVLAADDFSGVARVSRGLEAAGRDHERLRTLKAYSAYFAYAVELRHGTEPQNRARAKVVLDELGDKYDLKYLSLAGAARAAVEGNLAKARRAVVAEISRDPRSVDAQVMSAEISMLERRPADALQTWQLVAKLEPSPRASFGLARAYLALGQYDAATASAEQTISRNPNHVGARLLIARMALNKQSELELAQKRIGEALSLEAQQSVADYVLGKTLTGDLHLLRSRISLAEAAYQEALEKNPRSAAALRGLGETLYRAGRYSESLARFEAGLQADPDDVMVAVGAAKTQLALERVREASASLARLRLANPKHYSVNYWYAKAEEAAGNRDEAEKGYAAAIEVGGTDPIVVDAYVSMALLKNQQGRREEAQKVLATAQEKLPRMPKIHEAIGQLALAEGRYAGAVEEFKSALTLEPNDLGVKFRLGVALRKNREFEAASKAFDEVMTVDRDYPGLALERGQLYEASGQTEEALRAFESALAKAPTDPDLMLRVGCGKVAAGSSQQSEQLLKKVLEQRPTSAETHHCLGRAQLLEGSNLALALRTLERAVELDPHRAEYHLYVGWAANEAGRVALAEQSLKKALELDQGLGDAYWQRGILRYRQGAVKDAVADLTRALELRPGRYEAHASLADAYFDLGFEQKALEQWRLATVAQPDNATWRYRYGKLLQAAHRDADAKPELETALALASKLAVMPRWAWEAHHLLARAIGAHPTAVKHWQAFLDLAPRDNVYRDEAKQALAKLGQPWDRD